jgi:hypothetical protein
MPPQRIIRQVREKKLHLDKLVVEFFKLTSSLQGRAGSQAINFYSEFFEELVWITSEVGQCSTAIVLSHIFQLASVCSLCRAKLTLCCWISATVSTSLKKQIDGTLNKPPCSPRSHLQNMAHYLQRPFPSSFPYGSTSQPKSLCVLR